MTRILALTCALVLASCGSAVKMDGDEDTHTTDTSVTDTAVDTVDDVVEDVPADVIPDAEEDTVVTDTAPGCITAGCQLFPDGGLPCCETLVQVSSCPPWDTSCVPVYHCVLCGNGTCDPHEAPWSCRTDCSDGCEVGTTVGYACSESESYDCTCEPPPCTVECEVTMGGTRWVNSCTGDTYSLCSLTDRAECRHIGTDSEGWYFTGPMGGENLIVLMPCANHWVCT